MVADSYFVAEILGVTLHSFFILHGCTSGSTAVEVLCEEQVIPVEVIVTTIFEMG